MRSAARSSSCGDSNGCSAVQNKVIAGLVACSALIAALGSLGAQDTYPTRPVQIIVPFPPGGNTDILTRIMADRYAKAFKQPFIVVSKPGAGANIGAAALAMSEPDGNTLLMAPPGPIVINQYLYAKLPFDPEKSFSPIVMVARFPNVLVVHPSLGVRTIEELIAKAKANPNTIDYATSGIGSTSHLSMSLFLSMADVKMNHIPYTGTGSVAAGSRRGPRQPDHRQSWANSAFHQVRAIAGARRFNSRAGVAFAGRAADRFGLEWLRGKLLERVVGSGRNAAGRHQFSQSRSR